MIKHLIRTLLTSAALATALLVAAGSSGPDCHHYASTGDTGPGCHHYA